MKMNERRLTSPIRTGVKIINMITLEQIIKAVSSVATEYPIERVMLFGSYAEGSNTPESDVDLLVEFSTKSVSLLTLSSLKNRMEEFLGIEVDIIHSPLPKNSLIKPKKVVQIYAA